MVCNYFYIRKGSERWKRTRLQAGFSLPFTFRELRVTAIAQSRLAFLEISSLRMSHPCTFNLWNLWKGKISSTSFLRFSSCSREESSSKDSVGSGGNVGKARMTSFEKCRCDDSTSRRHGKSDLTSIAARFAIPPHACCSVER